MTRYSPVLAVDRTFARGLMSNYDYGKSLRYFLMVARDLKFVEILEGTGGAKSNPNTLYIPTRAGYLLMENRIQVVDRYKLGRIPERKNWDIGRKFGATWITPLPESKNLDTPIINLESISEKVEVKVLNEPQHRKFIEGMSPFPKFPAVVEIQGEEEFTLNTGVESLKTLKEEPDAKLRFPDFIELCGVKISASLLNLFGHFLKQGNPEYVKEDLSHLTPMSEGAIESWIKDHAEYIVTLCSGKNLVRATMKA